MPIRLRQYIEDYDDLRTAHQAYLADLRDLGAKKGDAHVVLNLTLRLQKHIDCLNKVFDEERIPRLLSPEWRADAYIFVGEAEKRFWTFSANGQEAVLIDFDLVVRLVLLIYMVGIDKEEDIVAQALASFLLLSVVVPRDEEFPRLLDLLIAVMQRDERVVNDLIVLVGDFILFHEIGHSYVKRFGTKFSRVAFHLPKGISPTPNVVRNIQFHPEGPVFNQIYMPGNPNGMLLLKPNYEHWTNEIAADIFSAYANLIASAEGRPELIDLERLADWLTCWQHLLYVIGWRELYMRSNTGKADVTTFSHPSAHIRMDVIMYHINFIAEEFTSDWQSPAIGRLFSHYQSLWASDLAGLVQDGIEYVRYAFDEDGPHINIGRLFTLRGEPIPFVPSALSKLGKNFLSPFLAETERTGWDRAVEKGREQYLKYFETFRLNGRAIILELGKRLHDINLRIISEDRR